MFKDGTLSKKAYDFAKEKHSGQTRMNGSEYFSHPVRVAEILLSVIGDSKVSDSMGAAALLHDTVEDTNTTLDEINKEFGLFVTGLVDELTSDKSKIKELGKTQYLINKLSRMSARALDIKLSDRYSNIEDLGTIKTTNKKFYNRYYKETIDILDAVEKNRTLSASHKKLISMIRTKLAETRKLE